MKISPLSMEPQKSVVMVSLYRWHCPVLLIGTGVPVQGEGSTDFQPHHLL
jgi:hypothetical protein